MFASIVIAYLLEAVVSRLQKTGMPRLASVIVVYLLFITVFLFLTFGLVPIVIRQLTALVQQFPNYIAQGQELLKQLPQNYPHLISEEQIQAIISQLGQEMAVWGQQALSWSLASVASVISLVVYLVLVPVLIFFLLKDKDLMIGWLIQLPAQGAHPGEPRVDRVRGANRQLRAWQGDGDNNRRLGHVHHLHHP